MEPRENETYKLALGETLQLVPHSKSIPIITPAGESDPTAETFVVMDPLGGDDVQTPTFIRLSNLTDRSIVKIAAYPGGICAVTEDDNEFLFSETVVTEERNEDASFSLLSSFDTLDVFDVDCGAEHTVAIALNAQTKQIMAFGMGNNSMGQLGLGRGVDYTTRFKPIRIPGNPRFVQVKCGTYFTLMLTHTSDVWVFGHNARGQLGIDMECEHVDEPTLCQTLKGVPICSVAAGTMHSLALSVTGTVFGAGSNHQGQLGLERNENYRVFTLIQELSNVFIVHIAAYGCYSAAIDEFGTMYVWGGKFGRRPTSMSMDGCSEKFVDVALGSDGRIVALTSNNRLIISGFYSNDEQITVPVTIDSPRIPFCRIYSGGEYFVVLADQHKPLPLVSMEYATGKTLLPPPPIDSTVLRYRMRPPRRIIGLASAHFPSVLMMKSAHDIIRIIFSSMASLNGSFLVDNFSESLTDVSCGMDIYGIIAAYEYFMQSPNLLLTLTNTFNRLLLDIQDYPPIVRRPGTMRFLVTGLLHPSPVDFREGYDFWRNLVNALENMNVYPVFAQWFSVMNIDQIKRVLRSLKDFLTVQATETRRMYSPIIIKTVKAIEMIWFASTRSKKLSFDLFYHEPVNQMIDVGIEYQLWSRSDNSWCFTRSAPWLLNADTKTRFLRINSREMMNRQQVTAMQNATQFWGTMPVVTPLDLFLIIQVDREDLVTDTFRAIAALKNPDVELKKPLKILFKDEPGVDEGGVQREFFQLIVQELFDPSREFFTNNGDVYWFNPEAKDPAALQAYYLTGCIFGLAIYNGNLLNVRFPLAVYKKLRGLTLSFTDLKELDETLMHSLESVLEYTGDVENDFCLAFEYLGNPICEGGDDRMVTNANREEYVETMAQYILQSSIQEQFGEFRRGFIQAAGSIVLDLFRPEEIALLIAGREELDFVALEEATRYEGYTPDSPTVRAFWNIVHNRLTDAEKKRLLYFVTSSPRAPINGLGSIPFVIARDGDPNHIPTSHTCFFMLVLPDDPNEETLYRKVKIAIENAEGFAFK